MLKNKKYWNLYFELIRFNNEISLKYKHRVYMDNTSYDMNKFNNPSEYPKEVLNTTRIEWKGNKNLLDLNEYANYMQSLKDNLVILDWINIESNLKYINQCKTLPTLENSPVISLHKNHKFLQWWNVFTLIYPYLNKNTLLICKEHGFIPIYPNQEYYKYGEYVTIKKGEDPQLYLQYFNWPRINYTRMVKKYYYATQTIRRYKIYTILHMLIRNNKDPKYFKLISYNNNSHGPSYNPIKSTLRKHNRLQTLYSNTNPYYQGHAESYSDTIDILSVIEPITLKDIFQVYNKLSKYKLYRFTSNIKYNKNSKGLLLTWPINKTNGVTIPANKIEEPINNNSIYPFFVGLLDACGDIKPYYYHNKKEFEKLNLNKLTYNYNCLDQNNNNNNKEPVILKNNKIAYDDINYSFKGETIETDLDINFTCRLVLPYNGANSKLFYGLSRMLGFNNPKIYLDNSKTKLIFSIQDRRDLRILINIWDVYPPLSSKMLFKYFKFRTLYFIDKSNEEKNFIFDSLNSPDLEKYLAYHINKDQEHSIRIPSYYDDWLSGYFTGRSIISYNNDNKLAPAYLGIYANYNETHLLHYFKVRFNLTSPLFGAIPGLDLGKEYFADKINVGAFSEEDILKLFKFLAKNPPFGHTYYKLINFFNVLSKINPDILPFNNYLDNMPSWDDSDVR